jgi:adenosylcobinamide-phosphate synthase
VAADPWLVLAAAALEGAAGYPRRLHAVIPHPVAWIGGALRELEARLNRGGDVTRRLAGCATLLIVAGSAAGAGLLLDRLLTGWWLIAAVGLGSLGLAARSLYDHVAAVSRALGGPRESFLRRPGDLPAARAAVAMIVGRDTESLDREGVAAAALESLAESFNDGGVAPLFWFLVGGLAGLVAGRGWRTMLRDAGKHASPNSGWPEAAMAGALGVQLGGPASYDGVPHDRPTFGDGPRPSPLDLHRGLGLYLRACAILAAALALGGLAWPR